MNAVISMRLPGGQKRQSPIPFQGRAQRQLSRNLDFHIEGQ